MDGNSAEQRPNQRKVSAELSRNRLLLAACTEFAERGYAGARVEEISRRTGMSPRMLYHYFGSKEQLYEAVALENFNAVLTNVRAVQLAHRNAPVIERLRVTIAAYLEALHTNETYLQFAQWESAGGWGMVNRLKSGGHAGFEQITRTLVEDVEEGVHTGVLRPDLEPSFVLALSGLLGTYWAAYFPRVKAILGHGPFDEPSSPRARRALVEFFLRGIAAVPSYVAPGQEAISSEAFDE